MSYAGHRQMTDSDTDALLDEFNRGDDAARRVSLADVLGSMPQRSSHGAAPSFVSPSTASFYPVRPLQDDDDDDDDDDGDDDDDDYIPPSGGGSWSMDAFFRQLDAKSVGGEPEKKKTRKPQAKTHRADLPPRKVRNTGDGSYRADVTLYKTLEKGDKTLFAGSKMRVVENAESGGRVEKRDEHMLKYADLMDEGKGFGSEGMVCVFKSLFLRAGAIQGSKGEDQEYHKCDASMNKYPITMKEIMKEGKYDSWKDITGELADESRLEKAIKLVGETRAAEGMTKNPDAASGAKMINRMGNMDKMIAEATEEASAAVQAKDAAAEAKAEKKKVAWEKAKKKFVDGHIKNTRCAVTKWKTLTSAADMDEWIDTKARSAIAKAEKKAEEEAEEEAEELAAGKAKAGGKRKAPMPPMPPMQKQRLARQESDSDSY